MRGLQEDSMGKSLLSICLKRGDIQAGFTYEFSFEIIKDHKELAQKMGLDEDNIFPWIFDFEEVDFRYNYTAFPDWEKALKRLEVIQTLLSAGFYSWVSTAWYDPNKTLEDIYKWIESIIASPNKKAYYVYVGY